MPVPIVGIWNIYPRSSIGDIDSGFNCGGYYFFNSCGKHGDSNNLLNILKCLKIHLWFNLCL